MYNCESKEITFTKSLAGILREITDSVGCKTREDVETLAIFQETLEASLSDWKDGQSKPVEIPCWIGEGVADVLAMALDSTQQGLSGRVAMIAVKFFKEFDR